MPDTKTTRTYGVHIKPYSNFEFSDTQNQNQEVKVEVNHRQPQNTKTGRIIEFLYQENQKNTSPDQVGEVHATNPTPLAEQSLGNFPALEVLRIDLPIGVKLLLDHFNSISATSMEVLAVGCCTGPKEEESDEFTEALLTFVDLNPGLRVIDLPSVAVMPEKVLTKLVTSAPNLLVLSWHGAALGGYPPETPITHINSNEPTRAYRVRADLPPALCAKLRANMNAFKDPTYKGYLAPTSLD
jgi:hypothetical protein